MKTIVKQYIKAFLITGVLIVICNVLSVLHPYIMKQVLDVDFKSIQIHRIVLQLLGAYLFIHILLAIIKNIRNIQMNKVMASLLKKIREAVFCKVLNFKMKVYDKYNSSEIYTRLAQDTENLFDLFFGLLQIILNNVVYIIFMVGMMFFANINLALIGCATMILICLVAWKFIKKLKKVNHAILDKRDEENKEYSELYNKYKLTYLFGLQQQNMNKVNQILEEELKQRKRYILINTFMYPATLILEAFGIYAILVYALQVNLNISLGDLYLVLFYLKQCRSPLTEILEQLEEMQTCLDSLRRINEIIKEKEEEDIEKGEMIEKLKGDIEFRNVHMKYQREEILKGISTVIKKGSKVTIVGRTGAGKTTLVNSIMRLYDIQSGQILIDGKDITTISIKALRNSISYISQTPYIFEDTLRNNIILEDTTISDEQIKYVLKMLEVESIFNKFENELDEIVTENRLSYGELQVIAFTRAILHKASIYIFDEPTSNIDFKTEKLIQNLIDKISENSTVLIVAHRKSTIEHSDKIIYMKDGEIEKIVNNQPVSYGL